MMANRTDRGSTQVNETMRAVLSSSMCLAVDPRKPSGPAAERPNDKAGYRVGGILFELGSSYAASFELAEIVKPALSELSRITGESAAFYVRAGAQRQCVFRVESSQTVKRCFGPRCSDLTR